MLMVGMALPLATLAVLTNTQQADDAPCEFDLQVSLEPAGGEHLKSHCHLGLHQYLLRNTP
ncbi:hypothetical protein Q31a_61930 [Aureliella helgolandensis]|uniref:Uncharacterized protein n=1 Tax=Aureliella helgolandensis TaxID=2527968 RepID=A0A518GGV2_9BACT|nr:hypothetical protein Q31a_61930 [Aureliella helgolandensis]